VLRLDSVRKGEIFGRIKNAGFRAVVFKWDGLPKLSLLVATCRLDFWREF